MNYMKASQFSLRKVKVLTSLALGCLLTTQAWAVTKCPTALPLLEEGELESIAFDAKHSRTLQSATSILAKHHYADVSFDDNLSRDWLNEYFDFLDPGKSFLLRADIDQFSAAYGERLDDFTRRGQLNPAIEIYTKYRERALKRLSANLQILEDPDYQFDFSTEKQLPTERDAYRWPESIADADERWHRQLTLAMLNLKLSGKEGDEARTQIARRYRSQLASLRQQRSQQVFDLYINALGRIYDPHTDYFSPRESENFEINMSLSLEGIGAVLQLDDEFTKVVSVVPGGPASTQSELQAADRIVAIGEGEDCEFIDVIGWRLDEVVDRIRGPKGTTVRLRIIPSESDEYSEKRTVVKIVRDKVKLEDNAAKGEIIEIQGQKESYTLGVIDIPSFYLDINAMRNRDPDFRSTTRDVRNILNDFEDKNVDGVIVDLRQNGGGSLLEAATLTDLFVDQGPIVQIRDQNDRIYRNHRARSRAYYDGPLMVMIDRLSASASEIFAGAIQDYDRGLVVGSQSFGKGTVQSVQPLPAGQLKLTESKFYRISGDSTQHKGVIPDIQLPSLFNPDEIGESSYDNALIWDQIRGIPHRRYQDFDNYLDKLIENHANRLDSEPDLKYLLGTISMAEERRLQKSVSLNEQRRIEERESWKAREEDLKQQWYVATGNFPDKLELAEVGSSELPTSEENPGGERLSTSGGQVGLEVASAPADVADVADVDADTETDANADSDENEPNIRRALLLESGRIFADLLDLTKAEQNTVAYNQSGN